MRPSVYTIVLLLHIYNLSIDHAYAGVVEDIQIACITRIVEYFKIEGVTIVAGSILKSNLSNLTRRACAQNAITYLRNNDVRLSMEGNYYQNLGQNLIPTIQDPTTYCQGQNNPGKCMKHLEGFPPGCEEMALKHAYYYEVLDNFKTTIFSGTNYGRKYMTDMINGVKIDPDFDTPEYYCLNLGRSRDYIIDRVTGDILTSFQMRLREEERQKMLQIEEEEKSHKLTRRGYGSNEYLDLNMHPSQGDKDWYGSTSQGPQSMETFGRLFSESDEEFDWKKRTKYVRLE